MSHRDPPTPSSTEALGTSGQRPEGRGCVICGAQLTQSRCAACRAAAYPGGYEVLRQLSCTQHSRVYLVRSPSGQEVALKELLFAQVPGARELEFFEREIQLLQQLSHPRIPRLLEHFQEGEGPALRLYVAQEFIPGETLLRRLEHHTFEEQEARGIALQVLEILEYLHGRKPRVLHRDIKPANLIRRPGGELFLVDFGSAREAWRGMTHESSLVGTFGYMPLEQLGGTVGVTSDLYALGATLVHLLGRSPPAEHFRPERGLSLDHLEVAPPLRQWLRKLTAHNPKHRYASADHARQALEKLERRCQGGSPNRPVDPVQPPPPSPQEEAPEPLARLAQQAEAVRASNAESHRRQQERAAQQARRYQQSKARYERDNLALGDFYRMAAGQMASPSWLPWVGLVLVFFVHMMHLAFGLSILPPLMTREGLMSALLLLLLAYTVLAGPALLRALRWRRQLNDLPFKLSGLGRLIYYTDGDWQRFMCCTLKLNLRTAMPGSEVSAERVSAAKVDMLQLAVQRLNSELGSIVTHPHYYRQMQWSLQQGKAVGHANWRLGGVLLAFCIDQLVPLQKELNLIRAVHLEVSREWITLPDKY